MRREMKVCFSAILDFFRKKHIILSESDREVFSERKEQGLSPDSEEDAGKRMLSEHSEENGERYCFFRRRIHSGVFFVEKGENEMNETADSRLAVVAIVVEEPDSVAALNELLHQYGGNIIGRMGVPCPARGVNLISVAMDAPGDVISSLTGKLGRLRGISVKTAYSKA